jgi:hypothetical protein
MEQSGLRDKQTNLFVQMFKLQHKLQRKELEVNIKNLDNDFTLS